MRTLDPSLKTVLSAAIEVYGGPLAAIAFTQAESAAERYFDRHGDNAGTVKSKEQIRAELQQMIDEGLIDVSPRPADSTSASAGPELDLGHDVAAGDSTEVANPATGEPDP